VRRDGLHGLDELGAARLAEGRVILAALLSECQGLSAGAIAEPGDMAAGLPSRLGGPAMRAVEERGVPECLAGLSAEQLRCLLFALAAARPTGWRAAAAGPADSCPARGTAATPQPPAATIPPRACGRPGPSPGSTI
jgi:hypothetical protein